MSALSIQPTYPIFTDIDGQPLEAGYVWIGTANLDPQTNPINVYWDAALTILAPQPIRTLAGYPSRNGTPARLYVNSDYSIRVMNRNGSAVYSAPTATERYSNAVITGINAQDVLYDPPFTDAVQTNVEVKLSQNVSVKDFGAVGDGTIDDTTAIQTAINEAPLGCDLVFPAAPDGYLISSTILLNRNVRLVFQGARAVTAIGPVLPGSYLLKKNTMTTAGVSITYNGATWSGGGVVGQSGNAGDGIVLLANNVILDQVCAISCGNDGIRIGSDSSGFNANIFKIIMPVCSFNGRHGIYINDNNPGTGPDANAGTIITPFCQANTGDGINMANAWFNVVVGALTEANTGSGIRLQNGSVSNTFFGGDTEANTIHDILVDAGAQSNCFFGTFPGAGVPGIVDNGNATIILGQYVNKLQATKFLPVTTKSVEINSAGGSVYLEYDDGTVKWRNGAGIISAGVFTLRNTTGAVNAFSVDAFGNFYPSVDNVNSCGLVTNRWSVIYAGTGTINTSDATTKQQVKNISEAEVAVAKRIKGLIKTFKFNDAVEIKGDGARIHVGVMAQEVAEAFEAEGLDPYKYAMFCFDSWEDKFEDIYENQEVKTENGRFETVNVNTGQQRQIQKAGSRFGIRYDQLLAFIIAAL